MNGHEDFQEVQATIADLPRHVLARIFVLAHEEHQRTQLSLAASYRSDPRRLLPQVCRLWRDVAYEDARALWAEARLNLLGAARDQLPYLLAWVVRHVHHIRLLAIVRTSTSLSFDLPKLLSRIAEVLCPVAGAAAQALRVLDLPLLDDACEHLVERAPPALRRLRVADASCGMVQRLMSLPGLLGLELQHECDGGERPQAPRQAGSTTLEHLVAALPPPALAAIPWAAFPGLTSVSLRNTRHSAALPGPLLALSGLRRLQAGATFGDDPVVIKTQLCRLQSLEALSLTNAVFVDANCLATLPLLATCALAGSSCCTPAAVAALAVAPSLKMLSLSAFTRHGLDDDAVDALANIRGLTRLELPRCNLRHLPDEPELLSSLRVLNLCGNWLEGRLPHALCCATQLSALSLAQQDDWRLEAHEDLALLAELPALRLLATTAGFWCEQYGRKGARSAAEMSYLEHLRRELPPGVALVNWQPDFLELTGSIDELFSINFRSL